MTDLKTMRDISQETKRPADAEDIAIQGIQLKLRQQMGGQHFSRVVVDSMTSIRRFAVKASVDPQAERTEIQSLLRFLSESNVTALVTATPSDPGVLTPEEILTRGEILLTRKWIERPVAPPGEDRPNARVRPRSGARRPFVIGPQGFVVG